MKAKVKVNNSYKEIRNHFKKVDPIIHKAMEGLDFDEWINPYKKKRLNHDYFGSLCVEIIGQQLSGASATAIRNRFKSLFKDEIVEPNQLLTINDQQLRDVGMSWAKAKYVKNIAEAYLSGSVKFNEFDKLTDEEIIKELVTIKGVGPWTAEMFLMFTLNRPDIFSFGDLGLKKGILKLYQIEKLTDKIAGEITNKWKPYRSYGSITLWHTLDNKI